MTREEIAASIQDGSLKGMTLFTEQTASDCAEWLAQAARSCGTVRQRVQRRKVTISYYDVPASFDIETTSLQDSTEGKAAFMYIWMFGIAGRCVYGRTWDDFVLLCDELQAALDLGDLQRLLVYVHNLAFEFQFMRKWMDWPEVFAVSDRKPVKALCAQGIEFRCSYILTNESLAKVGQDLRCVKLQKLTGDLDYSLTRHSGTVLTDEELAYCRNDILVVQALILDRMEQDGSIIRIPLTKTGYVRRHVRACCLYQEKKHRKGVGKYHKYRDVMRALQLTPNEYRQCKRAFQGGFTHASAHYSGEILKDVDSFDIASSYPAVMCSELFPMSRGRAIYEPSDELLEHAMRCYCCLIDIEFTGLQATNFADHPISASKCRIEGAHQIDNGRIVYADHAQTTVTDIDMRTIRRFYTWDSMHVPCLRVYVRGYLPKDFVLAVLNLYADKTQLKGVAGREIEYMQAKGNINSCFGMAVTDIVRDELLYLDDWSVQPADAAEKIEQYNRSAQRFLFYPWGVFITAYARRNLFMAIEECGADYVYSDTDSVKILNGDAHRPFFDWYSRQISEKLKRMCERYEMNEELTRPLDPKGRPHPLGVFEYEGRYDLFKTLGAKRYLTSKNGVLTLTCAGVNKSAAKWLKGPETDDLGAFRRFSDGLYIPAGQTGKLTHTYIDVPREGSVIDYRGIPGHYMELSSVHLAGADYSLSMAADYVNFLLGIKEVARYEN